MSATVDLSEADVSLPGNSACRSLLPGLRCMQLQRPVLGLAAENRPRCS